MKSSTPAKVGHPTCNWDYDVSLAAGKAMTRDGRMVFNLREAVIDDGETVLLGEVSQKPLSCYKPNEIINTEAHIWRRRGAFGRHGGDDLVTIKGQLGDCHDIRYKSKTCQICGRSGLPIIWSLKLKVWSCLSCYAR